MSGTRIKPKKLLDKSAGAEAQPSILVTLSFTLNLHGTLKRIPIFRQAVKCFMHLRALRLFLIIFKFLSSIRLLGTYRELDVGVKLKESGYSF